MEDPREQVVNPADARSFQMTDRQKFVHGALHEKDAELAVLYESALRVLWDESNPGRLFLAAHSIREMMDGLPKVLALPKLAAGGKLGDQVDGLKPVWVRAVQKSKCHGNARWAGEIDGPLQKLLHELDKLFQWKEESRPKREDAAAKLLRRTDPSGLPVPKPLERMRADAERARVYRWLQSLTYFNRAAHRSKTTAAEVRTHIEAIEEILLHTLFQRTSEDLSAIDAILAEETPDA